MRRQTGLRGFSPNFPDLERARANLYPERLANLYQERGKLQVENQRP